MLGGRRGYWGFRGGEGTKGMGGEEDGMVDKKRKEQKGCVYR